MLKHTLFEKPKDDDEDFSDPRAKLIQERLRHYIKHYRSKRNRNRFFSRFFERVVIVVAGTLTVLLGLKNVWEYDVSRIAFVLSAAVTAATTWDAFADHHWKWIRYRAVLHQLFALRDELRYRMVGEVLPTQAEFDEFFERLQATVKELDEEWTAQRLKLMKDKAKTDVISSGKLSGA